MTGEALRWTASTSVIVIMLAFAGIQPTMAQTKDFNVPAQSATTGIPEFARQAGIQILVSEPLVRGKRISAVTGSHSIDEALAILLKGTGLTATSKDGATYTVAVTQASSITRNSAAPSGASAQNLSAETVNDNTSGPRAAGRDHTSLELDEVIVTAQKREQRLVDVPISIAALSAAELKESRITNIAELSLAIPGLAVADSGTNYRMVFIRGVANGDPFSNTTLVGTYLDETATSSFGGGAIDLRTYDLARVEVLRGPQGTLYGEGSMGGTIRFITNDPKLDRFSGSGDVTLSYTEHGDPSQDIILVANIPLVDDKLAIRVSGDFQHIGGWIDEPAANAENINFQNVTDVRTKILWTPMDALKITGLVNVHRNNAGAPNYGEDANGNYTQTLGKTTVPAITDNFDIYNLALTYDFGSFAILNSASYQKSLKQLHDVGNVIPISGLPPAPPDGLLFNWAYAGQQRSDELRATSTGSGPWNWTVGTYFRNGQFNIVGPYLLQFASTNVIVPINYVKDMSTKSWSFFGQSSYKFFDRLELGVGFRYFTDDQGMYNGQVLQQATFHSLDPRVYANFDLGRNVRLYASAAKGFRSGGFNVNPSEPAFGPESIWTYELGTKALLLNGRIDTDLAVYYSDYANMQTVGLPPPPALPVDFTVNAGTAHIKGVDFSFAVHATDAVSAGFKGTYTDAKYVKVNVLSADHAVGDPLDYVPQYSASTWGKYAFRWGEVPGFIRVDYMKQGKSSFRNRTIYPPPLLYGSSSSIIDMVNLNVGWQWNNVSLGVFANNLTNERGYLDPLSIEGRAARPRPRTFGVSIGASY
jgi:iron complex outermembrane receptor protein